MKHDYSLDRNLMKNLVISLDIIKTKEGKSIVRRDECGDYNINGKYGHIYTDGKFWYAFIGPYKHNNYKNTRTWSWVKNELSFMQLWQDGDDEGVLRLDRMPDVEEAKKIRKVVGLLRRKKNQGRTADFLVQISQREATI